MRWLTDWNNKFGNLEVGRDYIQGELIVTGKDHRIVEMLGDKEMEIGRYMSANRNYFRDHNDERYKYNHILIKKWLQTYIKYIPSKEDYKWKDNKKKRYKDYCSFCKEKGILIPKKEMFFHISEIYRRDERMRQKA